MYIIKISYKIFQNFKVNSFVFIITVTPFKKIYDIFKIYALHGPAKSLTGLGPSRNYNPRLNLDQDP